MTTDNDKNAARLLRGAALALIGSCCVFLLMVVLIVVQARRGADPIVDRARLHCRNLAVEVRRGRGLDELRGGDATWLCTGSWDAPVDNEAWAKLLETDR